MKTIKELKAMKLKSSYGLGQLHAREDILELIDELFPCEQLRKLKARIEGTNYKCLKCGYAFDNPDISEPLLPTQSFPHAGYLTKEQLETPDDNLIVNKCPKCFSARIEG